MGEENRMGNWSFLHRRRVEVPPSLGSELLLRSCTETHKLPVNSLKPQAPYKPVITDLDPDFVIVSAPVP